MKLFLKSIAFFASFALLLTACSDDDTTDAGGGVTAPTVESSTISSAVPGNGKLQVVWNVPYDDNITTTRVSWAGAATNYVDCSMKYLSAELTATELEEQVEELGLDSVIFGDDYITMTRTLTLTAGAYTISVESFGSVELDTEATTYESAVTVYDSSTYTIHPEVAQITYDGTDAYITWGEVPADLTKVVIGYYKVSEDPSYDKSVTSITVTSIVEGGSITLTGAERDTYYTLTSYFMPDVTISADEYVTLDEDDYYRQIPQSETAAAAPANVSVAPGAGRIKVTWTAPEGTVSSIINVTDSSGGVIGSTITLSDANLNVGDEENVIYVYGFASGSYDMDASNAGTLDADTYTVSIYNKYNSDASESEAISGDAAVYTATSYASYVPTATGGYADNVVVTWANTSASDLESVTLTYGSADYVTAASDLSGGTEFAFVSGTTTFTYTSTFAPVGGFEELSIVSAAQMLTEATSVDFKYNTSNSRYEIYTAKGLKAFADLVNGNSNSCGAMLSGVVNSFGTANTAITGQVMATIDLEDLGRDVGWESISAFTGTFIGGNASGYEIKNLYIKTTSSTQGFFGSINGGEVYQITLVDPVIKVYDAGIVGALAGYLYNNAQLRSCYIYNTSGDAEVSINTTYGSGNTMLGGLVGRCAASYVYNCHNYGVPVINQAAGSNYTGGAVGHVTGDTDLTDTTDAACYIVNCSTSGDVTASGNGVGGFTGYTTGLSYYVGCANTGNVTAGAYVAGMIGYITGELKMAACYNTGDVSATSHYTGGVTGRIAANTIDVVSCYNTGAVSTTYSASSTQTQATANVAATGGVTSSSVYTQYLTLYSCYYVYASGSSFDLGIGANVESVFAGIQSNMDDYGVEKLTTGSEFSNKVSSMNDTLTTQYATGGVLNGYATSTKYTTMTKYGFSNNVTTPYNPTITSSF